MWVVSSTTAAAAVVLLFTTAFDKGLCQAQDLPASTEGVNHEDNLIDGTTTRFWDCCKPSCAWNYKAGVDKPVKSCGIDGESEVGKNEHSGCAGGNSFSCNSYQPWAVNETFSYGFAAGLFHGQNESNWCCACYDVTFSKAPLIGKRMIVQTINSGGFGSNNINLQIPGGGVARSNGCQKQWGTPENGWGAKFGGISSEEECSTLPQQLRNGCKWRFEWLQNVGNPPIKFKRVECPIELSSISGCNRNDSV